MPGHVFIVRGDLRRLACDAQLLPTDASGRVESTWLEADPALKDFTDRRDHLSARPTGWGDDGVRTTLLPLPSVPSESQPDYWLTNVGGVPGTHTSWYMEAVRQFLQRAANHYKGSNARHDRDRPLLALPVVGIGRGGAAKVAGEVVTQLLEVLTDVTRLDVDVALVTHNDQTTAAAHWARRRLRAQGMPALGWDLNESQKQTVEKLATGARAGRLVLFLGAGVSRGAGLPDWGTLLRELATAAGFSGTRLEALGRLSVVDQARIIADEFHERSGNLADEIVKRTTAPRYSLQHGLLASLPVRESATMNYDRLFESAAEAVKEPFAVLPYQTVADDQRWLLKLHGSVDQPQDIVLTRDDYLSYAERRAALAGIVQALLITRHMLFVGFSLTDENFHRIAHDVRKAVRPSSEKSNHAQFGTALLVQEDPLMGALWQKDLRLQAMAPASDDNQEGRKRAIAVGARRIEIFLDSLLHLSSENSAHVLDDAYESVLDEDEQNLRRTLMELSDGFRQHGRIDSVLWEPVVNLLERYGAAPRLDAEHRPNPRSGAPPGG